MSAAERGGGNIRQLTPPPSSAVIHPPLASRQSHRTDPSPMFKLHLSCKRLIVAAFIPLLLVALIIAAAQGLTSVMSSGHCHATPDACGTEKRIGLLLGCSKKLGPYNNLYFVRRMQAAAELWHAGKLSCIIVSGDNSTPYYNEPRDMRESLIELGVPADAIVEDFGGICTYDSVVRARDIFCADHLLIISQPGHVRRAVAIARCLGMDAEGYEASNRGINSGSRMRQSLRECGARVSMLYDLLSVRKPKFMGQCIPLPSDAS